MNYWALGENTLDQSFLFFLENPPVSKLQKYSTCLNSQMRAEFLKYDLKNTTETPVTKRKMKKTDVLREGKKKTMGIKDKIGPINIK